MSSIGVDWQQRVDWDVLRAARIERLKEALRRNEAAAVVVQRYENLKYVTSLRPFTSMVYSPRYAAFATADGSVCLLTEGGDYDLHGRDMPWITDLRTWSYDLAETVASLEALVREHGLAEGRLAYDDALSPAIADRLRNAIPSLELVDGTRLIAEAKAVKHPEELKVMRRAHEIAEAGMAAAIATVRAGARELDVAAEALRAMVKAGADAVISFPQISSDPIRRMATDQQIRDGDIVLIDFNIGFSGYIGDFARCVAVGTPTEDQRRAYRAQRECVEKAVELSRAGNDVRTIQDAVAGVADAAGLRQFWQLELTGHGLGTGLGPYEQPLIAAQTGFVTGLEAGMVIAYEPGFFAPRLGPIRTEDVIVVTDGAPELLTRTAYDERLLG